jgi:hypothetical protein
MPFDIRNYIKSVIIVIYGDEIAVVTYYKPATKVGMALAEEKLLHAALELSLNYDVELEVLREGVDYVEGR